MRRSTHLRLDRRARKADKLARALGMRVIHRATSTWMDECDPRLAYLVDILGTTRTLSLLDEEAVGPWELGGFVHDDPRQAEGRGGPDARGGAAERDGDVEGSAHHRPLPCAPSQSAGARPRR